MFQPMYIYIYTYMYIYICIYIYIYIYIDPLSVAALIMYGKSIMTETMIGDGM